MIIAMHTTALMHGTVLNDIEVTKQAGFEAIELQYDKICRYLDAGYSEDSLKDYLEGLKVVGLGSLFDVECQGEKYDEFMLDADKICRISSKNNIPMVQMLTGPWDHTVVRDFAAGKIRPDEKRYLGQLGKPEGEAIKATAKNLAAAADVAKQYNVGIYLEPVAWSPVNTLKKALQVIEQADKDNLGFVFDLWHLWASGDTPDDVAKINKNLIKNVHLCDALAIDRSQVPEDDISRDVWTGAGVIPLKEWIDAIKSTGYNGSYSCELFSSKAHEQSRLKTALALKGMMEYMLL